MADYIYYNGELYHADKKKHKYVAKVSIGNDKYRYFYSKEEYDAYMNRKTKKKSLTKRVSNFLRSIPKSFKKLFKKSKTQVSNTLEKGRKFVDEVIFGKRDKTKPIVNFGKITEKIPKYIQRVKMSNGKYRYFYDEDEYTRYLKRTKYQKNEPDFMSKIPEISEEDSHAASDTMSKVNPDYSRYNKGTSRNCANCTAAYELRCRGYDVEAAEYKNTVDYWDNGTNFRFKSYYKDAKTIALDDSGDEYKSILKGTRLEKKFDYSANTVTKSIIKHSGNSTRGDISVTWSSGGGHSMAYEVDNKGKVTIRDCQTNKVYTVEDIAPLVTNITITRTDNLELKKGILNAVEGN